MNNLETHLDKLPLLLEVVKRGSIRRTAKDLRLSQPALSRAMRCIEDALEMRLFLRSREGIQLTQQGVRVVEYAKTIKRGLDELNADLRGCGSQVQTVDIGAYESISVYLLPAFLTHIESTQHNFQINIHTAPSRALMEDLSKNRLDLIISVNPKKHRELIHIPLFEDDYRLYQSQSLRHENSLAPVISVFQATDLAGKSIQSHLLKTPLESRRRFNCESFETVKALTISGLGIGILPSRVARPFVEKGELRERKLLEGKKSLWRFGQHLVALSYQTRRSGDQSILQIVESLRRYLSRR